MEQISGPDLVPDAAYFRLHFLQHDHLNEASS